MTTTNGAVRPAPPGNARGLTALELELLQACHEVTLRNNELVPRLAQVLGVPVGEVFYAWSWRRCQQRGSLPGTDWTYFFHGQECDLASAVDGRRLRVDFGPGGRLDTFTGWGVSQLVMTTVPPWAVFPELKAYLSGTEKITPTLMESLQRLGALLDGLEAKGMVGNADPGLVDFTASHTTMGQDGIRYVTYPPGTSERQRADCGVAHRKQLTAKGRQVLGLDTG